MIVGITGGIGAGKSTVTRLLVELGADAVDADRLAHEALETPSIKETLVDWLGRAVLGPGGKVDRKVVARQVFSDSAKLRRLEALVHPLVLARIEERLREHEAVRGGRGVLVLDAPLLDATPLRGRCDAVVFVEAGDEARRRRTAQRRWEPGELERREGVQTSLAEKRRRADHVIDNSSSLEETRRQVAALFETWKAGSLRKERGA